jgi:hypothetical protein
MPCSYKLGTNISKKNLVQFWTQLCGSRSGEILVEMCGRLPGNTTSYRCRDKGCLQFGVLSENSCYNDQCETTVPVPHCQMLCCWWRKLHPQEEGTCFDPRVAGTVYLVGSHWSFSTSTPSTLTLRQ